MVEGVVIDEELNLDPSLRPWWPLEPGQRNNCDPPHAEEQLGVSSLIGPSCATSNALRFHNNGYNSQNGCKSTPRVVRWRY